MSRERLEMTRGSGPAFIGEESHERSFVWLRGSQLWRAVWQTLHDPLGLASAVLAAETALSSCGRAQKFSVSADGLKSVQKIASAW